MAFIGWLAVGIIAGLVAHGCVAGRRGSRALNLALGTAGAVGGGCMFRSFGGGDAPGFDVHSIVVALIGAVEALLTYHALFVYPGDGDG